MKNLEPVLIVEATQKIIDANLEKYIDIFMDSLVEAFNSNKIHNISDINTFTNNFISTHK